MPYRPYQDKTILSDSELEKKLVVMGPLGPSCPAGYHPNTMVLYFLLEPFHKNRLAAAIRGQSREKAPIFNLRRSGGLGSIDLFWKSKIAKDSIAGAIQFVPLHDRVIITHMTVRHNWRRMGVNSRLIDCICQRFPNKKLFFENTTTEGRKFVEGYNG